VIDELPAGAVLVQEIGDKCLFEYRPLAGAPEPSERMTELLLDGQQRLTALWRSLIGDYPERSFFVEISDIDRDEDGRRDYRVVPQARWWRNGARFPAWCDKPKQVLGRELVPLELLNPDDQNSYGSWLEQATDGDPQRMLELQKLVLELRQRFARFNLPYLALGVDASEAVVLTVFVKLNTRSVPLTAFDIIVARLEGETGESLHDLVASLDGQVPGLSRYIAPSDLVLPAAAFLQDKRPTQRQLVFMDFKRLIEDWPLIVKGAENLVAFLEQERIPDGARLPSEVVLAPLVALWASAPDRPDELGAVRTLLRRYLWRAFITSRYEFAAATSSFQDYRGLLPSVRSGGKNESEAPIFDYALPEIEEIRMAGWPKKRDRLARAVLAVSFLGGAHDIADGSAISPANVRHREYHHLFPVAHLDGIGKDERTASVALNCALITWRTNRTISAKAPLAYLGERVEAAALGETQIRDRLASHGIDFDDLAAEDFDRFLDNRARLVYEAFERLVAGSSWPA
jgi:hypothetical protein